MRGCHEFLPLLQSADSVIQEFPHARNARRRQCRSAPHATGAEHARLIQGIRDILAGRGASVSKVPPVRAAFSLCSARGRYSAHHVEHGGSETADSDAVEQDARVSADRGTAASIDARGTGYGQWWRSGVGRN